MKPFLHLLVRTLPLIAAAGCNFTFSDGHFFDFRGEEASRVETGGISPEITQVEIENRFGDVTVRPASAGDTLWNWELTCWASDRETAENLLQQVELRHEEQGDVARWQLVLPEPMRALRGVESNLTLDVPSSMHVKIENRGAVNARGLAGDVAVNNRHGDVSLAELAGQCEVENEHGDLRAEAMRTANLSNRHGATSVQTVTGDLRIDSQHGSVNVEDVQGQLRVRNQHGKVEARDVQGDAEFETAHANVSARNILGDVRLKNRHGSIEGAELAGRVVADNQHGKIDLDVDAQEVECSNGHAPIRLVLRNPDLRYVRAETQHNSIHIRLPASLSPRIIADVEHGQVRSDFPTESERGEREGDQPTLELKTRHGNIRVESY